MTPLTFRAADLAQLAERGIPPAEAERQLAWLARPPARVVLDRPCTVDDGIEQLSEARVESLLARHAAAAAAGRVSAFVPASGAATRMFKELLAAWELGEELRPVRVRAREDAASLALVRFMESLPRFAFVDELTQVLAARGLALEAVREQGPWRVLLDALLGPDGLDAARAPKGLLSFHRASGVARTAFEEHLIEACALASDADGIRVLHFTVSPEHREGFHALLRARVTALTAAFGGSWDVRLSAQRPATDTLAADPAGGPFRDEAGRLLFRPAGHGALLANLAATGAELVFLKNIDNVAVTRLQPATARWSRALVGLTAELGEQLRAVCRDVATGEATALTRAQAFAASELGLGIPAGTSPREVLALLDRPVRVCGMVANTGEPGGGPFWVRDAVGMTRQIVESVQVDPHAASQQAILRAATHFNPVFIAAALRAADGTPHALERFVDDATAIVTRKSYGGRELLALERPGLWNGAMARWHTRFVEVPVAVFNPVKTVFDLLRPEHQGD